MKKICLMIIRIYKKTLSKLFHYWGYRCKYYPTCSEYTKQAIEEYGAFKGVCLGTKRILKCNYFSKGGYDPLKKGMKK